MRFRFTTQRMMIAVAILGVLMGGGVWVKACCERRADCLLQAFLHKDEIGTLLGHAKMLDTGNWSGGCIAFVGPQPGQDPKAYCDEEARQLREEAAIHTQMIDVYNYHASHPWIPVPVAWSIRPYRMR
jgi:hypothetical protein